MDETEHLSVCAVATQSPSAQVCQAFCPFLVSLCAFAHWTFNSFYVLDTNPLTLIRVASIFFLLGVYFFPFIASSDEKSFLILVMTRFINLTLLRLALFVPYEIPFFKVIKTFAYILEFLKLCFP